MPAPGKVRNRAYSWPSQKKAFAGISWGTASVPSWTVCSCSMVQAGWKGKALQPQCSPTVKWMPYHPPRKDRAQHSTPSSPGAWSHVGTKARALGYSMLLEFWDHGRLLLPYLLPLLLLFPHSICTLPSIHLLLFAHISLSPLRLVSFPVIYPLQWQPLAGLSVPWFLERASCHIPAQKSSKLLDPYSPTALHLQHSQCCLPFPLLK